MQDRVDEAVAELRTNPLAARHVKALKGPLRGKYRRRIGDWRLFFTLNHETKVISVLALDNRKDSY